MKYDFLGVAVFGFVLLIGLTVIATFIVLGIFLVKALIRYIKSKDVRKEKSGIKKSLGEVLKQHREECKMTQEFVAESIGVSRQAVSKWENGTSDPSTSNLIAIAKLFNLPAEDLLHEVQ
ncbi:helix-turn-helix transcriptional regulator [Tissierella sp.]|uniref:helix-turn-helix transcriptional regulator n=1 Tax=Tissierella sp. TaxID=41274 RepID=UPI00304BD4A5